MQLIFEYLYFQVLMLLMVFVFMVGGFLNSQLLVRTALLASTRAGVTQVASANGNSPASGVQVLNSKDALKVANNTWQQNSGDPRIAETVTSSTFNTTAVNPETPPGEADTMVGSAQVKIPETQLNSLLHYEHITQSVQSTITDTVKSTIPQRTLGN